MTVAEAGEAGEEAGSDFLRSACVVTAGQDGVLVVVVAGAVDGEAPGGCGFTVAQPEQRLGGAVGEVAGEAGGGVVEVEAASAVECLATTPDQPTVATTSGACR